MKKEKNKKVNSITKELKHITNPISDKLTFGERASDKLAQIAGSWSFIILFLVVILLWISANVYGWINQWDPYPFILLNLALSLLAAIQAPIILMAQNRQSQKDRIRAEYDYAVNRRAEREITDLRKQLDRIERKLKRN
ncbi:cyclic nucleotide-binding protein [Candidatus Pacearchaeota archaeon CG10_big_fil_rev_8_21_14_0_10_35_219]|nr:DUF1003 domain-containing protein [Candidatus Pacearchaeota archaeon]OIO42759.1 MAG: hypothetical protein AUJ63_01950 [Candidatus Pacearchaeota archaeon CG1_02_35_32]PIO08227.1 MAG: cyclic nucleotide-binding protein [Candidatus Pacearchaeota archaeon CG10_big_fil_rev_8_21_14_0_10_35_219]PIY81737.1 MAG: cyclic nucleotide-binding protein [Candidatus Pacearchaeota archaeon CG_4_10_14_0_8_um_filter_35_169]PIZ80359.1 MAG: cyclic nucleotide-binding protein [Candidatus Pacearchaeota archaeon CG_4_1